MAYTHRQMADLATGFFDPISGIEIVTIGSHYKDKSKRRWVVLISESEALNQNLDTVIVESMGSAREEAKFDSLEKAFAVMEAYIRTHKE